MNTNTNTLQVSLFFSKTFNQCYPYSGRKYDELVIPMTKG